MMNPKITTRCNQSFKFISLTDHDIPEKDDRMYYIFDCNDAYDDASLKPAESSTEGNRNNPDNEDNDDNTERPSNLVAKMEIIDNYNTLVDTGRTCDSVEVNNAKNDDCSWEEEWLLDTGANKSPTGSDKLLAHGQPS